MKCQFCGADASVHLTDIVGKKKRETHLCEACAKAHDLLPGEPGPQLNLTALLHLLMAQPDSPIAAAVQAGPDVAALTCPSCGLSYPKFRADGRLGCPDDYDAFRTALEPLLEKAHRGLAHAGKVPAGIARVRMAAELDELKAQLAAAVAAEQYEHAARLRDDLRAKEAQA